MSASTATLIRPVRELIADVTAFMSFDAGDVLLLGVAGGAPRARGQHDRDFGRRLRHVAAHADCGGSTMKTARVIYNGALHAAEPAGDGAIRLDTGRVVAEEAVEWLPPVAPRTTFALGLNYADHAKELAFKAPSEPLIFLKGPNTFIGHRSRTVRPADATHMHYECELAVVIGRPAQREPRAGARLRGRLYGRERLRNPRLSRELLPPEPAREEPRHLHAARAVVRQPRRDRRCGRPDAAHDGERPGDAARQHARHDLRRAGADRAHQRLHDALAGRPDPDRHARGAGGHEAGRRGRDRDRRDWPAREHDRRRSRLLSRRLARRPRREHDHQALDRRPRSREPRDVHDAESRDRRGHHRRRIGRRGRSRRGRARRQAKRSRNGRTRPPRSARS